MLAAVWQGNAPNGGRGSPVRAAAVAHAQSVLYAGTEQSGRGTRSRLRHARKMASGGKHTISGFVSGSGGMSAEGAGEYIKSQTRAKRYQRDVY